MRQQLYNAGTMYAKTEHDVARLQEILTNPDLLANYTKNYFTYVVPIQEQQGQYQQPQAQDQYQQPQQYQYQQQPAFQSNVQSSAGYNPMYSEGFNLPYQQEAPSMNGVDLSQVPPEHRWRYADQMERDGYFRNKKLVQE